MTEQTESQTITIDDVAYSIDDLSDEVKELLSLHAQANNMMVSARRQAIIHEVSVTNLANLIAQKVKGDDSDSNDESAAAWHGQILGRYQPERQADSFPRGDVRRAI